MTQQAMRVVCAAFFVGLVGAGCAAGLSAPSSQVPSAPATEARAEFVELVFEPRNVLLDSVRLGDLLDALRRRCSAAAHGAAPELTWVDGQLVARFASLEALGEVEVWTARLGRQRRLTFEIVADEKTPGFVHDEQYARLRTWRASNPGASLDVFNALSPEQGGPVASIRWRPRADDVIQGEAPEHEVIACERAEVVAPGQAWLFDEGDVERFTPCKDMRGHAAIGVEIKPARQAMFGAFTATAVDRQVALAFDGAVSLAPFVASALYGFFPMEGSALRSRRDEWIRELSAGPLPCGLELVALRKSAPR